MGPKAASCERVAASTLGSYTLADCMAIYKRVMSEEG